MSITINVDIDLDDFYSELHQSDKEMLLEWILEDLEQTRIETAKLNHLTDPTWTNILASLNTIYYRLDQEEVDLIQKIAKKYL